MIIGKGIYPCTPVRNGQSPNSEIGNPQSAIKRLLFRLAFVNVHLLGYYHGVGGNVADLFQGLAGFEARKVIADLEAEGGVVISKIFGLVGEALGNGLAHVHGLLALVQAIYHNAVALRVADVQV